jgi:TRAP-type C4-dicarboxylate transport system substrate-binding protein
MLKHPLEMSARPISVALYASLMLVFLFGGRAPAEEWNFYMHQSAPNFATSRGAKLFTEEIEKATNGALKVRLHLAGTLQINASNITQAVGENVVQIGDDLFNSGNIPVAGIPRLPMLIQSYEDFAKADAVL